MQIVFVAILPAATTDLHHNVYTHFLGDNDVGIDRSSLQTESGLRVMQY